MPLKRIAIFASGSGSNAQRIMEHFKRHKEMEVAIVLSNRADSYVLQRADNFEIPTHVFSKEELYDSATILQLLKNLDIDIIVLAGFLWLIPANIIQQYPKRIINIHPALLPKSGGKGMYGDIIHETVLANRDHETGITIHYVNETFDEGEIIYQNKCVVENTDTAEKLAYKVHQLEHLHYPRVIEDLLKKTEKASLAL
jgi:phosphoribosylglycinamide formyltransferase-1